MTADTAAIVGRGPSLIQKHSLLDGGDASLAAEGVPA